MADGTWMCRAAATDETNRTAIAILSFASLDNDDDLEVGVEYPVRYTSWNGLLDAVVLPGLSRQDKEAALFEYLMRQSTNDLSFVDGEARELIRIGMCECRDLNYTNALPIVRNFVTNPTAHYMDEPVYIYYKWAPLDDDYLSVTRTFLTNTSAVARERKPADSIFLEDSMKRHKTAIGNTAIFTNAVRHVYQFRGDCPECAIVLDRMFDFLIADYRSSANRLETVNGWLASEDCPGSVKPYCVGVTNLLMNVDHPLSEIAELTGL